MGALLIVAAFAAQAAGQGGSTPSTDASAPKINSGETTYLDVEGGVGYSSNPQLSVINDEGSAFGRVSVHGVHSRVSARTSTLLSAFAEDVSYTNHHGSQQSVSLYGHHDAAVSEHVRLFGDVRAAYQESGQLDTRVLGLPVVPPPIPGGTVIPPIFIPPSGDFLSVTGKEYSVAGNAGGTFGLSPRDSLTVSSGIEHVVFHSAATRTAFTRVPVALSYDRQLSPRATVGARVTGEDTEYDGPASFRVITPQLTGRVQLAERISLDGAIGVSFARVDDGLTVRHSTGVSANADLCGQGESSYFCGYVSLDQQAATTAGPARSFGGGINYSQRLDANQSIDFSLGATHYSTPRSVVTGLTFSNASYYHVAAAYTRRLGSRIFGGVNLAARKLTQNGPDPKTDLNGSLFIRYRFGDAQ